MHEPLPFILYISPLCRSSGARFLLFFCVLLFLLIRDILPVILDKKPYNLQNVLK